MSQWIEIEFIPEEFEGLVWVATLSSAEPILCETWVGSKNKKRHFDRYALQQVYCGFLDDVTHFHEMITTRPLGK